MSDDDYFSDLTDIDDDDNYGKPTRKKPRTEYTIKSALKVPRATTYTAQALYDQIHSDDIKLDPEYQRDVVWPDSKMVGLIDSVFRNFYIPPIIFAVVSFDDGSEKKVCIDGKQRLTSIQRFMDGLIPHKDPITNQKLWYFDDGGGGRRKKLLPQKYRTLFANKQIVCVEYHDITDNDEREIFQRVQLGMALTPAEKLQVINTPRAAFVRSLLSHFLAHSSSDTSPGAGSLVCFDWERSRGGDFRCIAQIISCLYSFPAWPNTVPIDGKSKTLEVVAPIQRLEKFLTDTTPFPKAFEDMVRETLTVMGAMAADKQKDVKEVFTVPTKLAPIEVVVVGLFIGVFTRRVGTSGPRKVKETKEEIAAREDTEKRGRRILAAGIREMRRETRKVHVDVRTNSKVSKTLFDFVRKWTPESSVKNGIGENGEIDDDDDDESEEGEVPLSQRRRVEDAESSKAKVSLKRKAEHLDQDGDWRMDGSTSRSRKPATAPLNRGRSPPAASPGTTPRGIPARPSLPLPPRPDRMAALRAAKAQVAQERTTDSEERQLQSNASARMPIARWGNNGIR